jgi:Uma2 family endonuclease
LFVAREHLHRLSAMRPERPADLVVKLISEESQRRDRIEKMAESAEAGIPEYWTIDAWSNSQHAAFYQLGPDRRYHPMPLDGAGRFHSKVLPQFWLCPDWLWRDPLPQPMDCLAEIEPEVLKRWPMGDTAREDDERCSTE